MQCRNCGAPVRGCECEYCGSWYGEVRKPEDGYWGGIKITADSITIGYAPCEYISCRDSKGHVHRRLVDNV